VFLRAIEPYVLVKASQVRVALGFMERRVAVGQGRARASQEAIERNRILDARDAQLLQDLKERG
jgi:hypothetical protein